MISATHHIQVLMVVLLRRDIAIHHVPQDIRDVITRAQRTHVRVIHCVRIN